MVLKSALAFLIIPLSCYVQCAYCYRISTNFYRIVWKQQNFKTCKDLFATQKTAVGFRVSNQTGQCNAIFSLPDNNQTFTDEYTYAIKISEEESYKPSIPFDELEDKVWAFPGGIKNGTVVELLVTMPIVQKEAGEDMNVFGVFYSSHPINDKIMKLTELLYLPERGLDVFSAVFKDNMYSFMSREKLSIFLEYDNAYYSQQFFVEQNHFLGKQSWKITFRYEHQYMNVLIDDSFFNQYLLSDSPYEWLYVTGFTTLKKRAFIHHITITPPLG